MKTLLLTLLVLLGLLLCVAGVAGMLITGFDVVYGSLSLVIAVLGGALLAWGGGRIRSASRAEAEGAPGKRSRPQAPSGHSPLDKGQRL